MAVVTLGINVAGHAAVARAGVALVLALVPFLSVYGRLRGALAFRARFL